MLRDEVNDSVKGRGATRKKRRHVLGKSSIRKPEAFLYSSSSEQLEPTSRRGKGTKISERVQKLL